MEMTPEREGRLQLEHEDFEGSLSLSPITYYQSVGSSTII